MQYSARTRRITRRSILAIVVSLVLAATAFPLTPWGQRWVREFRITRQLKRLGAESVWYWNWRVPCVEEVGITGAPVTQDMLSLLAQLPNLRILWIAISREDGGVELAGVSQLRRLERLSIVSGGGIRDEQVYHLTGPKTLEVITFHHSDISDAGLMHLARFPKLRTVRIYDSRVTAAGVAELKRALPDVEVGWKKHRLLEDSYYW